MRDPVRPRRGRAADRERHRLRPRGRGLDARHLPRDARGEDASRRHRLGEPYAADLRRGAVGRLQAERHRPRAGQVGRRRVSQRQTGVHQSFGTTHRLVLKEATMTYYAGKELAAAFRTVRENTIKIAEEIPESKYDFRPAPESRSIGQTLAH